MRIQRSKERWSSLLTQNLKVVQPEAKTPTHISTDCASFQIPGDDTYSCVLQLRRSRWGNIRNGVFIIITPNLSLIWYSQHVPENPLPRHNMSYPSSITSKHSWFESTKQNLTPHPHPRHSKELVSLGITGALQHIQNTDVKNNHHSSI